MNITFHKAEERDIQSFVEYKILMDLICIKYLHCESKFLKIEKLSRLSRDGADFLDYQKEAIAFIDQRIKELKIPPKT